LASGVETTIAELASMINQFTGNLIEVDLKPARDWDRSGKRFGSIEKSRNKLQFEAIIPIQEGIKRTVEWTIVNRERIKHIIANHDIHMR